jgi:hypothetical protein
MGLQSNQDNAVAQYIDSLDKNVDDSLELLDAVGHVMNVRYIVCSLYVDYLLKNISAKSFLFILMQRGSTWKSVYSTETRRSVT